MPFLFERQDAYRQALDFVEQCERLTADFTSGVHPPIDELRSRALSIPIHIAATNAFREPSARADCLEKALRDTLACVPIIEILERRSFLSSSERHALKLTIDELIRKLNINKDLSSSRGASRHGL